MSLIKYQINKDIAGSIIRTVEADTYKIADGYFHFYDESGERAKRVFSIATERVLVVEVIED